MRKRLAARAIAGLVVASMFVGGCLPAVFFGLAGPIVTMFVYLRLKQPKGWYAKSAPIDGQLDVQLSGSIGGLDGQYDITVGSFGQFTGTAKIGKNRKSAKVSAENTDQLRALVHNMVMASNAMDVTVTDVKVNVTGKQTTGGVEKSWSGKLSFKATVASGENVGQSVKGTIKSKGEL